MSFSVIGANPAWGIVTTSNISSTPTKPSSNLGIYPGPSSQDLAIVDVAATFSCAAVNTSGVNKPLAGWITYTDEGGGGPSGRPESGLVYPRLV